jgi:hypothetical protein
MNTNKNILWATVAVIGIAILAYLVWASVMKTAPVVTQDGTICTMDALQCPDGSWVGRSGPNCQFVCPIPMGTSTPKGAVTSEAKLNQKVTPILESITPLEVIEDSRCPNDVQCIQAGTVRVRVRIDSGSGVSTETFSLNGTVTTETEAITLIAVRPEKESTRTIASGDYTFIFRTVKR